MITNILSNHNAIKLLYYFLENPNIKQNVTTLKNKTNFSNNLLYSSLDTLITYKIINKTKNQYELNFKTENTLKIIEILREDKLKFKLMPLKTFLTIKDILKDLEDKKVNHVYLFGSFARGTARTDSDIDLVVLPSKDLSELQYKYELKKIKIDFHSFDKFNKNNPLHNNILKEGIKII